MGGYLVRQLVAAAGGLIGLSLIVFLFLRIMPGSTTTMLLGSDVSNSPEQVAELRHQLGLDRPIPVQYLRWLGDLVRGQLGKSLFTGRSVWSEVTARLPTTFELSVLALGLSLLVGIPVGVASAVWRDSAADQALRTASIVGLAVPNFWLGTMVLVFGARWFGWIPPAVYVSPTSNLSRNLQQFVIPAAVLGLALAASLARMSRSTVLEVLGEDYVRTARAKGLAGRNVLRRHALPNSMIPVLTLFGVQVGYVVAGSVVVESVFSLPGLGRLLLDSIGHKDYPLAQGIVLLYGALIILVNLLVDFGYSVLDPRVRLGARG